MIGFVVFVALFLASSEIGAQVPSTKPCPDFETAANFNLTRYLGKWYEVERFFTVFELEGKCITAEYIANNGTVKVVNRQISIISGNVTTIEGSARPVGRTGEAKFGVTFPNTPTEAPYWVLGTDYDNYALVWSCTNFGAVSARTSWILSRTPVLPANASQAVNAIITKNQIERGYYSRTDQTNCPKL